MEVRIQAAHGPVDVSVGERDISFRVAGRDVLVWVVLRRFRS
ncbi:MAG TPA: hypothetical protein VFL41_07170 [Gaiellaceae bacterium]|nr:hypothetical protein [Gaiellaceae bacterium]